jgi:hypothetical protein
MMKKLLIVLPFFLCGKLFSQTFPAEDTLVPRIIKDTSWKTNGFIGINFSQTTLSNWQGGGEDNFTVIGILNYEANYKKDKNIWENKVDAQYGIIRSGTANAFKKNVDQLLALTKFSLKATEKYWYYTLTADFRTQFSPGYNYYADSVAPGIVSNLMAPAYIQLALGLDFRLDDYFVISFSPAAGKVTIVNDRILANQGAFGVKPAEVDTAGNIIKPGERIRYEFGSRVTVKFKKDVSKNVSIDSYADFFSNYSHNPGNIDIVWNTLVNFKITKFISATISTKLIYDDDIVTKYDWNQDGAYDHKYDINGPRAQWLNSFGFGLGYKF